MRSFMNCVKCGKQVVKVYGFKDLCNLCHTKSLNLSARGTAEMKKLKDELKAVKSTLKTLRTTLSNHKLMLKTAHKKNEKIKADNAQLESLWVSPFKNLSMQEESA